MRKRGVCDGKILEERGREGREDKERIGESGEGDGDVWKILGRRGRGMKLRRRSEGKKENVGGLES